jgi:hypothetical protein
MVETTYTMFPVNVSVQCCVTPRDCEPIGEGWKWLTLSRDGKASFWTKVDATAPDGLREWDYTAAVEVRHD